MNVLPVLTNTLSLIFDIIQENLGLTFCLGLSLVLRPTFHLGLSLDTRLTDCIIIMYATHKPPSVPSFPSFPPSLKLWRTGPPSLKLRRDKHGGKTLQPVDPRFYGEENLWIPDPTVAKASVER